MQRLDVCVYVYQDYSRYKRISQDHFIFHFLTVMFFPKRKAPHHYEHCVLLEILTKWSHTVSPLSFINIAGLPFCTSTGTTEWGSGPGSLASKLRGLAQLRQPSLTKFSHLFLPLFLEVSVYGEMGTTTPCHTVAGKGEQAAEAWGGSPDLESQDVLLE